MKIKGRYNEEYKVCQIIWQTLNAGYTRKEISKLTGISAGGTLSDDLEALIASDFIIKYKPFGMGGKR